MKLLGSRFHTYSSYHQHSAPSRNFDREARRCGAAHCGLALAAIRDLLVLDAMHRDTTLKILILLTAIMDALYTYVTYLFNLVVKIT